MTASWVHTILMALKIDSHVHLIGVAEDNGCYMSPRLRRSIGMRYSRWKLGLRKVDDDVEIDRQFLQLLERNMNASELDRAVLLGLDGVYTEDGSFDRERTHLMVANPYVEDVCNAFPTRYLFGASVHPYRKDALDELDRVAAAGAVLVKLLPNSQGFDPGDPLLDPYYKKLIELRLPLLIHCGYEHTIPTIDQSFGHPSRIEKALRLGVQVIVAHVGSAGIAHFDETMGVVLKLMTRYSNCFGDTAALCSLARGKYLNQLLDPDLLYRKYGVNIDNPMGRLIHGSDFPIPINTAMFVSKLKPREHREIGRIPSALQKDIALKRLLGVPDTCLTRAHEVLGLG